MDLWLFKKVQKVSKKLDEVLERIGNLEGRIVFMTQGMTEAITRLQTEVQETQGAVNSAITLITGLSDYIKAHAGDPAALLAMADQLDAKQNELAAAVTANPVPPTP